MINYVDDALYTSNNEESRLKFEAKLKKKFNLTLMGQAKWYLGMRIKQHKDYMSIDQKQYVNDTQDLIYHLQSTNWQNSLITQVLSILDACYI